MDVPLEMENIKIEIVEEDLLSNSDIDPLANNDDNHCFIKNESLDEQGEYLATLNGEKKPYKYCIVPKCRSSTYRTPDKIFLCVPRESELRKKWCSIMKRNDKIPLSTLTRLHCCEDHFNLAADMENYVKFKLMGGRVRLKKGVVPHKFDCQEEDVEVVQYVDCVKRRKVELDEKLVSNDDALVNSKPKENKSREINLKRKTHVKSPNSVKLHGNKPIYPKSTTRMASPTTALIFDGSFTSLISNECGSNYKSSSEGTSTEDSPVLNFNLTTSKSDKQEETLMCISKDPKLLIGLPKKFYFCLNLLSKIIKASELHIMITLKKVLFDQSYSLLAIDFGFSKSFVTKVVKQNLPLIANCMKDLIFFPSNEKMKYNHPVPFRRRYYKVQSIIDCFEIQIEKPSNPVYQVRTWSRYKRCSTIKYLISVAPDGLINYISEGYGGACGDSCIFEDSDYLLRLPSNIAVLPYKGFKSVSHLLSKKGCILLRPPHIQPGAILSKKEILETKRIATLRIQVRRIIRRLREFGLLLPGVCLNSNQVNMLDFIVITACGIVNLQSTSYRDH